MDWKATFRQICGANHLSFCNGRQYIVIAVGGQCAFGQPTGDALVASALPV